MAGAAYLSCAATALTACMLLLRAYWSNGQRLLLWSGVCFGLLAFDNVLVFVDLVLFPEVDLSITRNVAALVGVVMLLYGLVWETK